MKENLFRKKSIERISSPEQIDDYIRVTNPSAWLLFGAIIVILFGVVIWGVFGRLDTELGVVAVNDEGVVYCYIRQPNINTVKEDMTVIINDEEYKIMIIMSEPVLVDDNIKEYAKYLGNLINGEWVYLAITDAEIGSPGEVFEATVVIEHVRPISFVLN